MVSGGTTVSGTNGEQGAATIWLESLQVKAMVQRPTLMQAISDVERDEFVWRLTYKVAWYGRTLIAIDGLPHGVRY